jgi:hypothetical protein
MRTSRTSRNIGPVTRGAILKGAVFGAALIGLALGIVDCSHRDANAGVGTVQFGLKLSSGAQIDTVGYLISGNGIPPITGTFDVSKFNTVTSQVAGIPAGKAYKVELSATSVDEKRHLLRLDDGGCRRGHDRAGERRHAVFG